MYISVATGIAIPLILLFATLRFSGFSYQLGPTCFIYHEHSFAVFWGWMIGFTVAAFLLQLATSGYCVTIYIMTHRLRFGSQASAKSTSTFGSLRNWRRRSRPSIVESENQGVRNFSRRRDRWKAIQVVLLMQWRIICLTVDLVIQCLYFGSISWASDTKQSSISKNPAAVAFGQCLFLTNGNRDKCLPDSDALVVNRSAILAGLGVMAVSMNLHLHGLG